MGYEPNEQLKMPQDNRAIRKSIYLVRDTNLEGAERTDGAMDFGGGEEQKFWLCVLTEL